MNPHDAPADPAVSAPELPGAVAKQYGLHHLVPAEKASGKAAPDLDEQNVAPVITDPKTDAAVEDIVARESDELLAAQDADARSASAPERRPRGVFGRIGWAVKAWVRNPWARWLTLLVLFGLIVVCIVVPPARYFALNAAGVRSSVGLTVLDNATRLPLKNVTVRIGSESARTDIKGEATLRNLKLGKQQLVVERLAFQTLTKPVTVGWGSNPLGQVQLTATGLRYAIEVRDYISDTPLAAVEATSSDGLNALSDKQGIITLTMEDTELAEVKVTIGHKDYRAEQVTLRPGEPARNKLHLVPAGKAFYLSNAGGKYHLHATDLDGKNNAVILSGTGNEQSGMSLAASPAGDWAALVSTRDGVRGKDGYVLRGLTLVSADGKAVTAVERAEQIRLIDWVGTRLIYQVTASGSSAASAQRNKLISYDYTTNSRIQLAAANTFSGVHVIRGTVYYAVGAADPSASPYFARVRPDNTARQTIWSKEVWTVFRTGYASLGLQTPDGWYSYTAGGGAPAKDDSVPNVTSRLYTESPDGVKTAWLDTRDGKGAVIVTDVAGGKEAMLPGISGGVYPLRWMHPTTLIMRVVTGTETADYAVSTLGGQPRKITDLTNSFGFSQQ